jgi:hypothetical protein
MEEIVIYKFQLEAMVDALRVTSNIHECQKGVTCHDRMVKQSLQYGRNALEGKKDKIVPYI